MRKSLRAFGPGPGTTQLRRRAVRSQAPCGLVAVQFAGARRPRSLDAGARAPVSVFPAGARRLAIIRPGPERLAIRPGPGAAQITNVGYSKLKGCVRLLFWSGQTSVEEGLKIRRKVQRPPKYTYRLSSRFETTADDGSPKPVTFKHDYNNIVKHKVAGTSPWKNVRPPSRTLPQRLLIESSHVENGPTNSRIAVSSPS